MKYTIINQPNSIVEIKIELNKNDLLPFEEKALAELAKSVQMNGYRQGKVPLELAKTKISPTELAEKTASFAIEEIYPKIILEEKINALGYPEVRITKIIPDQEIEFQVKVAQLKEILLPDYKNIAKEFKKKTEISVSENEIEETLKWIYLSRNKNAKEGEPLKIDDEFAQSLGNFKDLEDLKKNIKEGLQMEKEQKETEKWRIELLEKIMEKIKWDLPEILVETEIQKMIEELKVRLEEMNLPYDKYLEQIKKTEKDLEKDLRETAEKRVKIGLILREIALKEKISVSEEEVQKRTEKIISQIYDENLKEKINPEQLKEFVVNLIENEKVFSFLENQSNPQ